MPSVPAKEIVDKLFSNKKDLSSEVNDAMMAISAEKLEAEKIIFNHPQKIVLWGKLKQIKGFIRKIFEAG